MVYFGHCLRLRLSFARKILKKCKYIQRIYQDIQKVHKNIQKFQQKIETSQELQILSRSLSHCQSLTLSFPVIVIVIVIVSLTLSTTTLRCPEEAEFKS